MAGARLPRIDLWPLAWAAGAALLSLGGGLLVGASPTLAFDLAVVAITATAIATRPYVMLIAIALLAAEPRESFTFLLLCAGAVAVIARAPSLPGKRVIVPFLLLLLIALPSLPLWPSPDEGLVADHLKLPVVGFVYARNPSLELHGWLNLASVLVAFCLAAWAVRDVGRLRGLVLAVVASAVVPIAIAAAQLVSGDTVTRTNSTLESVRGPFPHPNYFAFYLVVVLVVAIVVFFESRSLALRIGVATVFVTGTAALFFTYTRAAWIGFALALLGMALLRYRRLLVIAGVALLLAVLVAPGAAKEAQQRFGDLTSKSEANDQNSWTWRVDQWEAILPYGLEKPLTGQGWDSYSRVTVRKFGHSDRRYPTIQNRRLGVFSPTGFSAHNDYVKSFVELGVPGLVLWVLILWGLVMVAWRARRVPGLGGIATAMVSAVFALMLISVSDNLQGYTVVLTYACLVCGALAGVTYAYTRALAGARGAPTPAPGLTFWRPPAEPEPEPRGPEPDAVADDAADSAATAPVPVRALTRIRRQLRTRLGGRRPPR